jgi:hypothetical protein
LKDFALWLYQTPLSSAIRDLPSLVAIMQSLHILAVAAVVGSALISDLRLAGVLATDESPHVVARRYMPWMWGALVVLLLTGLVQIVGEPNRTLTTSTFWLKMGMLLIVFACTLIMRKPLLDPAFDIRGAWWRAGIKPAAWLSLLLWIGVIVCGRWIAYSTT